MGLFGRAIAQSPALPLIADRRPGARQAGWFLADLGVSPGSLELNGDRPAEDPCAAAGGVHQPQQRRDLARRWPTVHHGTELLPRHPIDAARTGALNGCR